MFQEKLQEWRQLAEHGFEIHRRAERYYVSMQHLGCGLKLGKSSQCRASRVLRNTSIFGHCLCHLLGPKTEADDPFRCTN